MPIFAANLDLLKDEVDGLRRESDELRVQGEKLQSQLAMFDNAAFEKFREIVLIPEMQRLANLRMELPSDQTMVHERIMGQFCEAKMLAEKKEMLAQELRLNMAQRQEQSAALADGERKLNRELKKRTGE
jgi:hypothetical protein